MTTEQKRQWVMAFYKTSPTWQAKVKKMSDSQVIAIYLRLQAQSQRSRAS
jgi:hypothetical protein